MTVRNWMHSRVLSRLVQALTNWNDTLPLPRGCVVSGEAGFRLRRNPDTTVGVDVAYIDAATAAKLSPKIRLVEGVPVLAVEVLSGSDTHEDVFDKIQIYLDAGTTLVWIVDPDLRTVTAIEANKPPVLFTRDQTLTAEPHLPGFAVPMSRLWE